MTYILDLQQLWQAHTEITPSASKAVETLALDPRHPLVSVVLVVRHSEEEKFLQGLHSIISQCFIREIIVIFPEGFALEKHLAHFCKIHPRCCGISVKKSLKLAQAYNVGAQYATGKFLLFLDSMLTLPQDTVYKLLATGIRKPLPWVVGLKAPVDKRLNRIISKLTNFYSPPIKASNTIPEVSLPGGGVHVLNVGRSGFLMPIKTFIELKGMDQASLYNTFHLDFCLRVHFAGGSVYEVPDVEIENPAQPSVRSLYQILSQEWRLFRASCYFYHKYVRSKTNFLWSGIRYALLALQALGRCLYRSMRFFFSYPMKSVALP